MYNTIISSMSKDDVLKVTNPEKIPGRTMIEAGDLSVYIDTDRLPELIFKLQACLPEPETEKIRTMRYITLVADDMPHSVIAEIAAEMMRGTK